MSRWLVGSLLLISSVLDGQILVLTQTVKSESIKAVRVWSTIKRSLVAPDGEEYFEDNLRGSMLPGGVEGVTVFTGTIVSAEPGEQPSTLVVAVADDATPDATLQLKDSDWKDAHLNGPVVPGTIVQFEGVPTSFTKEPFMLTLDVSLAPRTHFKNGIASTSAHRSLVPEDFKVDDVPISIEIPFEVFINGKPWTGHSFGWHIDRLLHPSLTGSTIWLGVPHHGMYVLSLAPRDGYDFQKAGSIRNNIITFRDAQDEYEIRTAGPILGEGRAWNLYMRHLPDMEMKGPLFGVDRLGTCTLAHLR